MAYDEFFADRVRRVLEEKKILFTEKKMMGGLLFMVDEKILCGVHLDKKYGDSLLTARVGEEAYAREIHKEECLPMDFTGRPMKGYLFITPEGFDLDNDLAYWVQLCLDFNPLAKASKKRKKKKQ
ncbi:MAG: RNA methyltransferase [Saprospiraceae bacterium]|nr:RNA methyltransferase [Saprospiraceae bacterium]